MLNVLFRDIFVIDLQLHEPDLFNNLLCLFNINNIPKTTEYTYFPAGLLMFLISLHLKIDGEEDKQWYPEFHRTTWESITAVTVRDKKLKRRHSKLIEVIIIL